MRVEDLRAFKRHGGVSPGAARHEATATATGSGGGPAVPRSGMSNSAARLRLPLEDAPTGAPIDESGATPP